jgi:hypothetical protein
MQGPHVLQCLLSLLMQEVELASISPALTSNAARMTISLGLLFNSLLGYESYFTILMVHIDVIGVAGPGRNCGPNHEKSVLYTTAYLRGGRDCSAS